MTNTYAETIKQLTDSVLEHGKVTKAYATIKEIARVTDEMLAQQEQAEAKKTPAKRTAEEMKQWNAVVKAIRTKYPKMSDKAVYIRAKHACNKKVAA